MHVLCPKCSSQVRLSGQDALSREQLKSVLCTTCGSRFDASAILDLKKSMPSGVPAAKTEALSSAEAAKLLARELGAPKSGAAWDIEMFLRKVPEKIGDYRVLEEVSRGGMGIVYKALDPQLKREVAIKVLLAGEGASEDEVKRFQREAQATARLQHNNIVRIYSVGTHEGRPYFVMDFVEGRTARQILKEGKMSPRLALSIIEGVADALHHAHQNGVIHRDVKPSNIIVDKFERPQLMDFGLARRVDEDLEITQAGITMGTPSYMSPEQADGSLHLVDAQSDVYSAGACLYELLTGHPPFDGTSTMAVLKKIIEEPPVPPRKRNPKIHRDVETICLKCLEKNKRDRYHDAKQLSDDIRRFNSGEAILAKPLGPAAAFLRKAGQHLELTAAAGLMVLFGLASLVYTLNEAHNMAQREIQDREKKLKDALESGESVLAQAEVISASLASARGDFLKNLARARELLAQASDSFRQAEAVASNNPKVKNALQRLQKLDNGLEVKRYIYKARLFLYPPQERPDDPPLQPNYSGAEFAAQEAVDRDPENAEARGILRIAVGIRKVSIDAAGADASVFLRQIRDSQGRQVASDASDPGKPLGRTPMRALEMESGLYILTFQRPGIPQQQAVLAVTRDAKDEDLAFKITLNCTDENMVQIPVGEVKIPEGDTVRVKAFAIDRFEYPNKAGGLPGTGFSLEEARTLCENQGKQLCTPAQWMRACKGNEQRRYPYGQNYISGTCATGFDADAQKSPMPSGFFARCRTPEGIYDMSGNVAEWTETTQEESLYGGDYTSTLKFSDLESSCRGRAVKEQISENRRGFRCCKALKN